MTKVNERVEECINVLQKSKSTKERKAAVMELSALGMNAEAALKELMKIVNGRDDFIIQGIAEEAVVMIGEPAIPGLKKLLKSLSRKKRAKGIGMLGEIALYDKETVNKILPLLKPLMLYDLNYQVRLDVVEVFRKYVKKYRKSPNVITTLGEILRKDMNALVRKEASEAIAEADTKLALNEILKCMDRKNYPIFKISWYARVNAAQALYTLGSDDYSKMKDAVPFLFNILENDPSSEMRISVLLPLIMGGGWNVIEDVLSCIAKDRWYGVRDTALHITSTLLNYKTKKSNIKAIMPIIKKISREDKFEHVQDSARRLLEELEEILKEDEE
ncbi:MAG: HEAT repeat domain-containing protein [Candidatus Heimdallarchaeota archaeon]